MADITSPSFPNGARGEMIEFRKSATTIPGRPFRSARNPSAPTICTNKLCVGYGTEYPEGECICDWCGLPTAPVSHLVEPYEYEAFDHLFAELEHIFGDHIEWRDAA